VILARNLASDGPQELGAPPRRAGAEFEIILPDDDAEIPAALPNPLDAAHDSGDDALRRVTNPLRGDSPDEQIRP
jgi:hypothetical protein